jgi:glucose/arabinose dehydrogenase
VKFLKFFLLLFFFLISCQSDRIKDTRYSSVGRDPILSPPEISLIPTVNVANASSWPKDKTPKTHENFEINVFSSDLSHPRWLYMLPNGDILVAETNKPSSKKTKELKEIIAGYFMKKAGAGVESPDRIILLRDSDHDGRADIKSIFLDNLNSPFGMALIGNELYIANTDALWRFHYESRDTSIDRKKIAPEKILDLPAGEINYHWTKNIIASSDGTKLYVTVGSNSNIAENGLNKEEDRATILEVDLKTKQKRVYASGLRNPNGLAWHPTTNQLWTVVNERDELGNDLVPDYLTSVNDNDFFGWPYIYYGNYKDPRVKELMPNNLHPRSPDYALGSHVAALGLVFSEASQFKSPFKNGVFVSEHGSWNRKPRSGYKVVFIPFENDKPHGLPIDVVTDFVVNDEAYGRPVGLVIDSKGNLLIADDVGNRVWKLSQK